MLTSVSEVCTASIIRAIFDKFSDVYAKYYSPPEHLAVNEI
jgi:hypothetical protein